MCDTVDVYELRYRSFILLSGWPWSSRCHDLEEVLDVPYSSGSVRARASQDAGVRVTEADLTSAHVFSVTRARMLRETTVTRNAGVTV